MDVGAVVLVVLALLGALLIVGLGFFAFSRVADGHAPPMPAGYRGSDGVWHRGRLTFGRDQVALRARGLSAGPWQRGDLDLGVASAASEQDAAALGRAGLVQVPVHYGTSDFVLALDEDCYTALRAWVEAVPPGWNAST